MTELHATIEPLNFELYLFRLHAADGSVVPLERMTWSPSRDETDAVRRLCALLGEEFP